MFDWKAILVFCAFLAAGFYWLITLARQGEPVAWIILLAMIVIIILGVIISSVIILVRTMRDSEQTAFLNNARENLAIIKQMQALQNAQTTIVARRNAQLERQVMQQLPPPDSQPAIILDNDIFDDLDRSDDDFAGQ